jgi:hypothetical protein
MAHTILVDDEVYRWLQSVAVPLDDTPNSVLRRLAGLDKHPVERDREAAQDAAAVTTNGSLAGRRALTGDQLISRWRIPARQARFHRDGCSYELLTRFPAALCDRKGFIVFETEDDLRACMGIRIGKQVHVRGGIASLPGYRWIEDPQR